MLKLINNTINHLINGATILYPTDTVWGIGCDATNENAVKRVYQLKQRTASKSLIILVNNFEMLTKYVTPPTEIIAYLSNTTESITVIYSNPRNLAQNLIAEDNTIAIRVVKDTFNNALISKYKKPIVSTSANTSGLPTPSNFSEIEETILNNVDYIVKLDLEFPNTKPSKIVKVVKGEIVVLRD